VRFLIIILFVLIFGSNIFSQEQQLSGLYFSSHEVNLDKRTSLNLTPDKPFSFPKGFSVEFEASFRPGDGYYGYIFRIIGDNKKNIDLVANNASPSSNFWLVFGDQILISYKWSDLLGRSYDKWMKVRLDIDVKNSVLGVTLNGVRREKSVPEIAGLNDYKIIFGACKNTSFLSMDVCPMSLKDIRILDHKNQLFREWKLSSHDKGKVFDEVSKAEAIADNPIWIIDRHVKWAPLRQFKIDNLLGVANDDKNDRLFFVNDKAVYIVSTETKKIDTIRFEGGSPYHDVLGRQIIYNKYTDEIWSYNFGNNEISRFNFKTRKWSFDQTKAMDPDFAHQNKLISPIDSSLVTLMGYGHYTYKAQINHYNQKKHSWERTDRSNEIEPRYLSGAGLMNNQKLLVFGGYGSKSGRQELSPGIYYDLYSFDLRSFSFTKLWTLPKPASPFVPCETLIYNDRLKCFYTLVYNSGRFKTGLRLARFSVEKPEVQLYNDSISYDFLDIESGSSLMLNSKKTELIAVTCHNADISMYSIAYPPLMEKDVLQTNPDQGAQVSRIAILLLFLGAAGAGLYFIFRKRKPRTGIQIFQKFEHQGIEPIPNVERVTTSAIHFMGGFQVFDRKGNNITSAFSPTLKQLFLFIFLNTIKSGKGVSSVKLDEVLWYDKSGDSARNNRNVNISKLRTVLDEVSGIEVINESYLWKTNLENVESCDYTTVLTLLHKSRSAPLSESEIYRLIALLSFGEFLPNVNYEWIDVFKSEFGNEIIDGLSSLFKDKIVSNSVSMRYHLADCILVYDPLNEEAFAMKCSVLYHLGKKGVAKNLYDSFCREYKQSLGINYSVSFNNLIK
jgi:DNA-binding SARP family transcriptional activator